MKIHDLPLQWYERPQYRPLLSAQGERRWFILSREELALRRLDAADCESRASGGVADRAGLAAAIENTYEDWGLPRAPEAATGIERLGRDETLCVVTGQQPGFLGGPLYVLYKALTSIALARWVEERYGRACVPVFWVAGEDHDIDEVRTARFPGGEPAVFSLPHPAGRAPLSSLPIDPASEAVIEEFISHVSSSPHSDTVGELAGQYRGRTVASGFAALLASLLGGHGLVFIDPEKLRPLSRPLVRQCIERPAELIERLEDGSRELEDAGLKPFVSSRLPLFLVRDGRRDHLAPTENGLAIDGGGPRFDRQELLEELEENPGSFSPGALLRPLIQDYLLPSVATVGGPAEAGYFSQMGPFSKWLGVEKPRLVLRFQGTTLAGEGRRAWSELNADTGRLAAALCPEDLVDLDEDHGELEEVRGIRARLASLDETLAGEGPRSRGLERGLRTAHESLARLENRIRKLRARGDADAWKNASLCWEELLPGGKLQERRWGYLHLIADHGTDWLERIIEEIGKDPFSLSHRLLEFES